ncbi:MAG: lipid asymmetry maintenance ABC transporter permease subunit MlaE [Cardiobacteriaceae bacterium]|nr:lipid asymmetry maintenance ABC transporter permease subunit MlaE [Cardiobacteriaceae bacterium]
MNFLLNLPHFIGKITLNALSSVGELALFCLTLLRQSAFLLRKPMLFIRAMLNIGVLSLPIIVVSGLFVGMVLALQGYTTLVQFGAEQSLGIMVALSLMRELGSVVSALLFAGRAGSSMTAEIGLMKTTEQLSALSMMGIEPLGYVGIPRFFAALLCLPLLVVIFVTVAMLGAYLVGVVSLGVDAGIFWGQMQRGVDFYHDIVLGMLLKGLCFGFVVALLACYHGFTSQANAQGLAYATTKTVVFSSLAVLGLDFILTAFMF